MSFVLCGNRKIRERVTRVDDEELYQQFASRASVFDVPDKFSRKDVKAVIDAAYKGVLSEEQFEYLFTVANEFYGSLRLVIRILEVAVPKANELNSSLTLEMLKETSKYFLSDRKPEFKNKTKIRNSCENQTKYKNLQT